MDFAIPEKTQKLLTELDAFIEDVIKPIEQEDDNIRFLTTGERTVEPIGTVMGYRTQTGRIFSNV